MSPLLADDRCIRAPLHNKCRSGAEVEDTRIIMDIFGHMMQLDAFMPEALRNN
jgi:hypothetical protein